MSSSPKSVTLAEEQTLTCTIGGLDSGQPVTVAWSDPGGAEVSEEDTTNYGLSPGTVDDSGTQEAELTIKTDKLATFEGQASFTYTCSVTSSQYADSDPSVAEDVVANVLTLGKST